MKNINSNSKITTANSSTLKATLTTRHSQRIHEAMCVARNSRAAEILNEALTNAQPRRRNSEGVTSTQFIFLLQLAISLHKSGSARQMVEVANALPAQIQKEMGLPARLPESRIYKYTGDLGGALDHSEARTPHLTVAQRESRMHRLDEFVTEYLSATIYRETNDPKDFAIDATAVPAPERHATKPRIDVEKYEADVDGEDSELTPENPIMAISRRGSKGASDATWRGKTSTKKSGAHKLEWFHGYFANAVASIPVEESGQSDRSQVYSFTLTSAREDMFDGTIRAIDKVQRRYGMENLVGDRYYSNLKYDRWWTALDYRGINPVNDLSHNQQGFTDFDGIKVAAAWPHCPATPPELGNIPTLGPQPTVEEVRKFESKISERELYAMATQKKFTKDTGRFSCPAVVGKVGCPIRGRASMDWANENGLTIVMNPPEGDHLPLCCVNETFTLNVKTNAQKSAFRNFQHRYWGGKKWKALYRCRSSIERVFGYAKQHYRLDRNTYSYRGFGLSTVVLTALFAEVNIRKLEKWAAEGNRVIDHPILNNPYEQQDDQQAA